MVQHVEWNLPNVMTNKMYCYGEASFEANQAMQESLEKLYKYENQSDIRGKIEEYISELNIEIDRCTLWIEKNMSSEAGIVSEMAGRVKALTEVKNDL